jgi:hypothetical protein
MAKSFDLLRKSTHGGSLEAFRWPVSFDTVPMSGEKFQGGKGILVL